MDRPWLTNSGMAGVALQAFYEQTIDVEEAGEKVSNSPLALAWQLLKDRENDIVRLVGSAVSDSNPSGHLPSLESLCLIGNRKNSVEYDGLKVIFEDGSAVTFSGEGLGPELHPAGSHSERILEKPYIPAVQ